jgi:hypothetical protein
MQMGGIDEAALDRLGLVTEMTKHVRVRAAAAERGKPSGETMDCDLWVSRKGHFNSQSPWASRATTGWGVRRPRAC